MHFNRTLYSTSTLCTCKQYALTACYVARPVYTIVLLFCYLGLFLFERFIKELVNYHILITCIVMGHCNTTSMLPRAPAKNVHQQHAM